MTQSEINIDSLLHTLRNNPDLPVMFVQNEQAISPGYHITEVKMSLVDSLDCGQGTDQWRELVIQLLDGSADSSKTYLSSVKIIGILEKALQTEQKISGTKLYFEFTPGNGPLQKSSVNSIDTVNNNIVVSLTATMAQCKPYQRALESGRVSTDSSVCCNAASKPTNTCCAGNSASSASACCS